MSRRKANYTTAFKTKLVLEVFQNKKTLTEIASEHNVTPANLQSWKKIFLSNAVVLWSLRKQLKNTKKN